MVGFLVWMAVPGALGADLVDVRPEGMWVKRREATVPLPAGVTERTECVVGVVVGRDGLPVRVEAGTCAPELTASAQALLGWLWHPPNDVGDATEIRFPFRLDFAPVLSLPVVYEDGWALNQSVASFRIREDGAASCGVAMTVHPDGALSDLVTNHPSGCRILPHGSPVRARRSAVRTLGSSSVQCTAAFTLTRDGVTDIEVQPDCPDPWTDELRRMVPRWSWLPGTYETAFTFVGP